MPKKLKLANGSTAIQQVTNLRGPVWEQQPNENYTAFERFSLFRDLGAGRTFVAVATEVHKDRKQIEEQAAKWRWKERAQAWDKHLDDIKRKAIEDAALTMASRQAKLGMMLQDKAVVALEALEFTNDNMPTARDVVQLAEVGVKIERLARGEKVEEQQQVIIQLPVLPGWAKSSQFVSVQAAEGDQCLEVKPDGTTELVTG